MTEIPFSLVTGGAGFIGSHLVEALVARGGRVRVLDNLSSGFAENLAAVAGQAEFVHADVRDAAAVVQAAAGVQWIFHLAALIAVPQSTREPVEAETTNAVGTLQVLQAARAVGATRVILASTAAVYGDEPPLPTPESSPLQPRSPYAISKVAAEHYCRFFDETYDVPSTILRFFNVYGPRQRLHSHYAGVIPRFLDQLARGTPTSIFGDGAQSRDFVQVRDAVRALLLAAAHPAARATTFNMGTGRAVSVRHLHDTLRDLLGSPSAPTYAPARPNDPRHSLADVRLIQARLGWQPQVSLEEGLRELVEERGG